MNKKLIGGLFALLFITSGVQSLAISKLQKTVGTSQAEVVSMVSQFNANNQLAAVGTYTVVDDEDNPSGLIISTQFYSDLTCSVTITDSVGGSYTWMGSTGYNGPGNPSTCNIGILTNPNGTSQNVIISFDKGYTTITGNSSVLVAQFKLLLIGYIGDNNQVTGKLDALTKNAIKSFQKAKGLSQTGVLDMTTLNIIDKIISSAETVNITGKMFNGSDVGGDGDPQGFTITINYYSDGTCTVTVLNDNGTTDVMHGTTASHISGGNSCNLLFPQIDNPISFNSTNNILVISGGSSTGLAQLKLLLTGYLIDQYQITGKLDGETQNALKSFQKSVGLSQTGTYGPQTKAALDKSISGTKASDITGIMFNLSK